MGEVDVLTLEQFRERVLEILKTVRRAGVVGTDADVTRFADLILEGAKLYGDGQYMEGWNEHA